MKSNELGPIRAQTRRLVLRPYEYSDYETWREGILGRKVTENPYDLPPLKPGKITRAFFRKLVRRHRRMGEGYDCYALGLFERKSGQQVGVLDISTISRSWYQWASIGYVVHSQFQGKGYGKEAGRAALRLAFAQLGYKRVEASIRPDNERSKKTALGMGMEWESLRREYIFDKGKWEDHDIYVALNPRRAERSYPKLK